jgi:hypothetical protein
MKHTESNVGAILFPMRDDAKPYRHALFRSMRRPAAPSIKPDYIVSLIALSGMARL